MILRVRLPQGRPVERRSGKNRHVALAFSALLAPVVLMAYVIGFWRLASDMELAGEFPFSGLLSHWQIWIPFAACLHFGAIALKRYGQGGEFTVPRILTLPSFSPRTSKPEADRERKIGSR
jgi:hypothetical protein